MVAPAKQARAAKFQSVQSVNLTESMCAIAVVRRSGKSWGRAPYSACTPAAIFMFKGLPVFRCRWSSVKMVSSIHVDQVPFNTLQHHLLICRLRLCRARPQEAQDQEGAQARFQSNFGPRRSLVPPAHALAAAAVHSQNTYMHCTMGWAASRTPRAFSATYARHPSSRCPSGLMGSGKLSRRVASQPSAGDGSTASSSAAQAPLKLDRPATPGTRAEQRDCHAPSTCESTTWTSRPLKGAPVLLTRLYVSSKLSLRARASASRRRSSSAGKRYGSWGASESGFIPGSTPTTRVVDGPNSRAEWPACARSARLRSLSMEVLSAG
mmetsp:Transcript_23878/g.76637  ORF Transcript_23878/g.76637 Transcript_23878/m.76637 type:complete len:323 (+) Transcript_23878:69-1037(+)